MYVFMFSSVCSLPMCVCEMRVFASVYINVRECVFASVCNNNVGVSTSVCFPLCINVFPSVYVRSCTYYCVNQILRRTHWRICISHHTTHTLQHISAVGGGICPSFFWLNSLHRKTKNPDASAAAACVLLLIINAFGMHFNRICASHLISLRSIRAFYLNGIQHLRLFTQTTMLPASHAGISHVRKPHAV